MAIQKISGSDFIAVFYKHEKSQAFV